jgi:hypothetical protein
LQPFLREKDFAFAIFGRGRDGVALKRQLRERGLAVRIGLDQRRLAVRENR